MALLKRFTSTCRSRSESPSTIRNCVIHLINEVEIFFGGLGGQEVERFLKARAQIERAQIQLHFARLDF